MADPWAVRNAQRPLFSRCRTTQTPASMRDDGSSHHYTHHTAPNQKVRAPHQPNPPEQLLRYFKQASNCAIEFPTISTPLPFSKVPECVNYATCTPPCRPY